MPYSVEHKQMSRKKIVESARVLFNRHGFQDVTIEMVMAEAGLTRGAFYGHFPSKEALYEAAVSSFLMGRGAIWREESGVHSATSGAEMSRRMINGYLSSEHLDDLDGQCPMIALPSDVARANPQVRLAYQELLGAMVGLFETGVDSTTGPAREQALSLAALCVGGMILARTLPDSGLAEEVRRAAFNTAQSMTARQ